jgi:hypothetical protein
MFLKLPIIGSDKPSKPKLANHSLGETGSPSETSGSDKLNEGSTKTPTKTSEGQKTLSREQLKELSEKPNHEAGDKDVSGKALKFTEIPKPLQDFFIKNLGINTPELQNQMIITEPSKINTNGESTSQFIIKLAPENAAKLLKKGPLHFLSKLNPFRNKSLDKVELNKLAEQIHTNTIPKVNHEISAGKITVQLLVNFNENTKKAEIGGLALSHRPVDFIHAHPKTLKIMEHLKKELPKLEKKLLNDKGLEPKSKEFIEISLADLNSFVNLNPKAMYKEIAAHAKGFIVLEHVARTEKEMKLGNINGSKIDVTNFAGNLMKGDGNWVISMPSQKISMPDQNPNLKTNSLPWLGIDPQNPKKVIERHHSFVSRFPYIDPRIVLLSSISEMLFHGKHLSEKQIKEALIANVESTIYNLENEAKRTNAK